METGRNVSSAVAVLGVPFDRVTTEQALQAIDSMVASGQPHYLVTANVDFLVQARHDVELRRILCEADLVLCDGTPVLWAASWLGHPLPERVAGADLVPRLMEVAEQKGYRVFFLGASTETGCRAVARVLAHFPHLRLAGFYSPPYRPLLQMEHEEICCRIRQAHPDLLLVCFGCPKQEKWIAMHYRSLGVPVVAGVGATIDFLAGQMRRAPIWMRRAGLEWVFRLALEPRRLGGRYFKDLLVFGHAFLCQWPGSWGHPKGWQPQRWEARLRGCMLNLYGVKRLSGEQLGWLLRTRKRLQQQGLPLILLKTAPGVERSLKLARVLGFLFLASDEVQARAWLGVWQAQRRCAVLCEAGRIVWRGEVTASNAEAVWKLTQSGLSGPEWRLDLGDVRFLDSSGLELMLRLKRRASRLGACLSLVRPQPAVRNALRRAGLESVLLPSGRFRRFIGGRKTTTQSAALGA